VKVIRYTASLNRLIERGVIPSDPALAKPWLNRGSSSTSLLIDVVRAFDIEAGVIPILVKLGLDPAEVGGSLWAPIIEYNNVSSSMLERCVHLLRHGASFYSSTGEKTILHILFKHGFRYFMTDDSSSADAFRNTLLKELFALCKAKGISLATKDANNQLPLQYEDTTNAFDFDALERLVDDGLVKKEDLKDIADALSPGSNRDRIIAVMYDNGMLVKGDKMKGYGALSEKKLKAFSEMHRNLTQEAKYHADREFHGEEDVGFYGMWDRLLPAFFHHNYFYDHM
jgi:hypothetical protein